MAKQKKPVHRVQMAEGKRNIIHQLLEEYDIETAEDIQDALKDLLGGTIKEMIEASFLHHVNRIFSAILLNCATCQSCKKTCKAIYFLHFFLLSLPALSILICKISFIFVHNYYFLSFSCLPLSNALL